MGEDSSNRPASIFLDATDGALPYRSENPVIEFHLPLHSLCQLCVVGRYEKNGFLLLLEFQHQLGHLLAARAVEISRWLIGEYQQRF